MPGSSLSRGPAMFNVAAPRVASQRPVSRGSSWAPSRTILRGRPVSWAQRTVPAVPPRGSLRSRTNVASESRTFQAVLWAVSADGVSRRA